MRVFLSTQAIDDENSQAMLRAIRAANLGVEHSPRNPVHGDDSRWSDWYSCGLPNPVAGCGVFVVVVDKGWDSSTWMGIEGEAWRTRWGGEMQRSFFWNPESISVSKAMARYLREELPTELSAAVGKISAQCNPL